LSSPRRISDFRLCKNKVYLTGESAGFISASSFEGISYAILSGKLLANSFSDSENDNDICRKYKRKTVPLRMKLVSKIFKRSILCSSILRYLIMKSGIQSIKKDK